MRRLRFLTPFFVLALALGIGGCIPPINFTAPTVIGAPFVVGNVVSGSVGSWAAQGPFSYRWERCENDGVTCATIGGATQYTYLITAADLNKRLRVVVSSGTVFGSTTVVSAATVKVTNPVIKTSLASVGSVEANGGSLVTDLSSDARYIVFSTGASNLTLGDANGASDILRKDMTTGAVQMVSHIPGSQASGNGGSLINATNSNGRYVTFMSDASNLVPGDLNGATDIFLWDAQTDIVSIVTSGADGSSSDPTISNDGRYVVYQSLATNLTAGDVNGVSDIFIYDTVSQTTELVSVDGATQGNGASSEAAISANGRYVAYDSAATNLATGDTNGFVDIFVKDRTSGTNTRVSIDDVTEANGASGYPSISADGSKIVFHTAATNLAPGDTNGAALDVVIADRATGALDLLTAGGNGASSFPRISDDNLHVTYSSGASNLVAGDTNGVGDVFLKDYESGETSRSSISSTGAQATGQSFLSEVSPNGRYTVFASGAANLTAGDTNGAFDIFLHDRGF